MPYRHGHKAGYKDSPTYSSWRAMRRRLKVSKYYVDVTCDPEWRLFPNFLRDMGERPAGMSLDRMDNNKGYYKENCRWTTQQEQCYNKRNNIMLDGVSFAKLCTENGIKASVARKRLTDGWSLQDACTIPVRPMKPKSQWGVLVDDA
jgi:hypothetical protein